MGFPGNNSHMLSQFSAGELTCPVSLYREDFWNLHLVPSGLHPMHLFPLLTFAKINFSSCESSQQITKTDMF